MDRSVAGAVCLLLVGLGVLTVAVGGITVSAGSGDSPSVGDRPFEASDRPSATGMQLGGGGSGSPLTTLRSNLLVELVTGVLLAKPPEAVPAFGVDSTTALTVVTTLRANNEPTFENPRREAIYDVIAESPGRYTAGVAALTGISASTVRYHVRVLEDAGLIQSMMIRGKRRFHLPELEREVVRIEAALADESTGPVLDAVARLEPVDVSSVAAEVDVARSTASYHLQQLEADDLVARERTGQTVVTRLDPAVRTYLEDGEGSGPAGSDEPAG